MLNLGMSEILLFAIIALIVLGPEKLPEAARFTGRWYGKLKRMISNVQSDIDRELRISELREQMQQELDRIKQLEEKMQAQMAHIEKHDLLANDIESEQVNHNTQKTFVLCEQPRLNSPYLEHSKTRFSSATLDLKKAV